MDVVHVDWDTWSLMVAAVRKQFGTVPSHIQAVDLLNMRRLGHHIGRPTLVKRWGCTDWRARSMMLAAEAMDSAS